MTPAPEDDRLMTAREVAYILGVSRNWVWQHALDAFPRIPCIRIGGGVRFRRQDIEQFIEEQRQA